jgi:2-hydroxychromene-2-carboxylate isomerase
LKPLKSSTSTKTNGQVIIRLISGLFGVFLPEAGIDIEKLKDDMKKPEIDALIKQDIADTKTLGVKATPEFFVNGKPLLKFGFKELQALIESEL